MDAAGVEPAVPEAADLQSTGVTNFPTHPLTYYTHSRPLCQQPHNNYVITLRNVCIKMLSSMILDAVAGRMKNTLIRLDFSHYKKCFIPKAARLPYVLSAGRGPRFLLLTLCD